VFYELVMNDDDRWHLKIARHFADGSPVDIWAYSRCERLFNPQPVPFSLDVDGVPVDYTPTAFGAIVVSARMADAIAQTAPNDVQRIPAIIDSDAEWEVLNILPSPDCIDHDASVIQYFPEDPAKCGVNADKAGQPRGVIKLVIDPGAVGGHHVLRPKGWSVVPIVSQAVKDSLDSLGVTGVEYWRVAP
jgi:hypothetical protein